MNEVPEFNKISVLQWSEAIKRQSKQEQTALMGDKTQQNPKKSPNSFFGNTGKSALVAELGFEPRQTESESVVLPLHNSAPHQSAKSII